MRSICNTLAIFLDLIMYCGQEYNFYNDEMLASLKFAYCLSNDFVVGKLEPAFKNIHNGDVLNSSSQNAVIVNVLESPKEYGTMILKINVQ